MTCGLDLSLVGNNDENDSTTSSSKSGPPNTQKAEGRRCSAFDAFFSPSFAHCVIECKGPDVPVSVLFSAVDTVEDLSHPEPMASGLRFREHKINDFERKKMGRRRGDLVLTGDENFMSTMRLATGEGEAYFPEWLPAGAFDKAASQQVHHELEINFQLDSKAISILGIPWLTKES